MVFGASDRAGRFARKKLPDQILCATTPNSGLCKKYLSSVSSRSPVEVCASTLNTIMFEVIYMRKGDVEEFGYITPEQVPAGRTSARLSTGQTVCLEYAPSKIGPRRFFLCPSCEARRAKLYLKGGVVACRKCHGLNYASSRRNHNRYSVVWMRADRAARKLGTTVKPPYFDEGVDKPKGMRWATYERLMAELRWCSIKWADVWLTDVGRCRF